jgi:hypothetical protein
MSKWKIAYSNSDGNTSVVSTEADQKPDMERVAQIVRDDALEYDDSEVPRDYDEPTVALLERHGITITGITEEG